MASSYKVLGQIAPNAASAVPLYTVPSATEVVLSTISVCNFGSASSTFRVAIRPNGESLSFKNYLIYNGALGGFDTALFTFGGSMDSSDVLEVYSTSGSFSFGAFGAEIS